MNNKIIIFNGPPISGKDTFADMLDNYLFTQWFNSDNSIVPSRESFKDTLLILTKSFYNIDDEEWDARYKGQKEEPWNKLGGLSQREALIDMSEVKIKPLLGVNFFGKAAAQKCTTSVDLDGDNRVYIFSDGGFESEIHPFIDKFGTENIMIIRLHREGFDFKGDSRGFLEIPEVTTCDVDSKDIDTTFDEIKEIVDKWIRL